MTRDNPLSIFKTPFHDLGARICFFAVMLLSFSLPMLIATPCSRAAVVTLAWDANNPAPDGYRLYQRLENDEYDYSQPVWQGPATTCSLSNLQDGACYYFVVRAYAGPQESGDSNEVRFETQAANQPPIADAGSNQTVTSQSRVILDGAASSDPENQPLTFQWSQYAGPAVTLSNPQTAHPEFNAPQVAQNTTLAFELVVSDPHGLDSADTCLVMITPLPAGVQDRDEDGYPDAQDAFPDDPLEWIDTDADGTGNNADTDDDNDQMPDAWEIQFNLDPLVDDAAQDPDGDGVSNLDEYRQGGDPTIPDTNGPPQAPAIIYPVDGETDVSLQPRFQASPFDDPDSADTHGRSQWRVFTAGGGRLVMDRTVFRHNLETVRIPRLVLRPSTAYECTVRYYDNHGNASPWSPAVAFQTKAYQWDRNRNGIPDGQEVGAAVDLNKDGRADNDQAPFVKTAQTEDGRHLLGLSIQNSPHAVAIDSVEIVTSDDIDDSSGQAPTTPYGLMGFVIEMQQPGQDAVVEMLSSVQPLDEEAQWVRYDEIDGWRPCADCTVINIADGSVQYRIQDGDEADADGVANGIIVDLSGPRLLGPQEDGSGLGGSDSNELSSDASNNGGCFLDTILR